MDKCFVWLVLEVGVGRRTLPWYQQLADSTFQRTPRTQWFPGHIARYCPTEIQLACGKHQLVFKELADARIANLIHGFLCVDRSEPLEIFRRLFFRPQ